MSYCHGFSGSYSNLITPLEGSTKAAAFYNSPLVRTVSTEPRRVNAIMWTHVSSRGICTQPYPTGVSIIVSYSFAVYSCIN
jgi:hypothetical protein